MIKFILKVANMRNKYHYKMILFSLVTAISTVYGVLFLGMLTDLLNSGDSEFNRYITACILLVIITIIVKLVETNIQRVEYPAFLQEISIFVTEKCNYAIEKYDENYERSEINKENHYFLITNMPDKIASFYVSLYGMFSSVIVTAFALYVMTFTNNIFMILMCILKVLINAIGSRVILKSKMKVEEKVSANNEKKEGFNRLFYDNKSLTDMNCFEGLCNLVTNEEKSEITSIFSKISKHLNIVSRIDLFISILDILIESVLLLYLGFQFYEGNISLSLFIIIFSSLKQLSHYLFSCIENFPLIVDCLDYFRYFIKFTNNNIAAEVNNTKNMYIDSVVLKQISYSYNSQELIRDVSATLSKGRVYMIKGKNGSGKSTLLKIISGYITQRNGSIEINGREFKEKTSDILMKNSCFIQQNSILYDFTIINNIFLGSGSDNERKDVIKILRNSGVIKTLKYRGLSYKCIFKNRLSEIMKNLSEGERQRFILARGLATQKKIIIFDEIDSNCDFEFFETFRKAIELLSKDRIIILVSHDLRYGEICDEVIEL